MGFFIMKRVILAVALTLAAVGVQADQKRTFAQVKKGCENHAVLAENIAARRMEGAPLEYMFQRFEDGYAQNQFSFVEKSMFQAMIAEVYDRKLSPSEEHRFFYERCLRLNVGSF